MTGHWLKRQQAVVAMGRRALAPPERSILIQDSASLLAETLDTRFAASAELSADAQSLSIRFCRSDRTGADAQAMAHQVSVEATGSLMAYVLRVAQPVLVADLVDSQPFDDGFLRAQGVRSVIAAPLRLQDRVFGSLAACATEQRQFDESDLLFVETIAHLVSTTVGRKQAEQEALSARQEAEQARDAVTMLELQISRAGEKAGLPEGADSQGAFSPVAVPPGAERRRRPRRSYPYSQMIGPVRDGALPDRSEFQLVECRDISAGGFSFVSPTPPNYDTLVVGLGIPPTITYLLAQVAHVTRQEDSGSRTYMVGCNYVGRAVY